MGEDMTKERKEWLVAIIIMVFFSPGITKANEIQQVETYGEIGFTGGVYETTGLPDPTPPGCNVSSPILRDKTLPQTNDNGSSRFLWSGILIINFVFLLWKRKNKQIQN